MRRRPSEMVSFDVRLFRYYAWVWLYLGPRGEDGRFRHQAAPYVPMRQEALFG